MKKTLFITLILLTFTLVTGCSTKNETSDSAEGTSENSTDAFITCHSMDEFIQCSSKSKPCKLTYKKTDNYFYQSDLIYDGELFYVTEKPDDKYKYLLDIRSETPEPVLGRTRVVAISNTYCDDMDEYLFYLKSMKEIEENGSTYYEDADLWFDFARDVYYEYKE